jgi:monoamine oxidase
MDEKFDCIIVGGGIAGLSAAMILARAGKRFLLVERGEFCGAKNVSGGVLWGTDLHRLVPEYWTDPEAGFERFVNHRRLTFLDEQSSFSLDFKSDHFETTPYSGYHRPPRAVRQLARRKGRGSDRGRSGGRRVVHRDEHSRRARADGRLARRRHRGRWRSVSRGLRHHCGRRQQPAHAADRARGGVRTRRSCDGWRQGGHSLRSKDARRPLPALRSERHVERVRRIRERGRRRRRLSSTQTGNPSRSDSSSR